MSKSSRSLSRKVRNDRVFRALLERKTMSVADIQDLLGVSAMTARRCLDDLHHDGLARRIHGGATAVDPWGRQSVFQQRLLHRSEIKTALVGRALEHVPENGSIFLDAGTTCLELAKQLNGRHGSGVIITDSIAAALEMRGKSNFKTILIGGEIGEDGNAIGGSLAADFVSNFSIDVLFFSASAFNDQRLENSVLTGTFIKKLLLPKAGKTVCIIDSVKYGRQRCFRVCGWEHVDVLITDTGLPHAARKSIQEQGVEIVLVGI
ncbi:MAG: DeoR/GlpR family DNA-binding transcription regulator [Planctomycetota bacterium]|jgi:DeoR/GlpR family transcriptional regulator of sugar metabolism|nr:DeoR/GlpR family DNA-binding transcription regulator [Planctomycetota bacterium]